MCFDEGWRGFCIPGNGFIGLYTRRSVSERAKCKHLTSMILVDDDTHCRACRVDPDNTHLQVDEV